MREYLDRDPEADYEQAAWRLIASEDTTSSEALILLWLVDNRDRPRYGRETVDDPSHEWAISDHVRAKQDEIAAATGVSLSTVGAAMKALTDKHVVFRGNYQDKYCFHQPYTWGRE